jgi:hypothetical protein
VLLVAEMRDERLGQPVDGCREVGEPAGRWHRRPEPASSARAGRGSRRAPRPAGPAPAPGPVDDGGQLRQRYVVGSPVLLQLPSLHDSANGAPISSSGRPVDQAALSADPYGDAPSADKTAVAFFPGQGSDIPVPPVSLPPVILAGVVGKPLTSAGFRWHRPESQAADDRRVREDKGRDVRVFVVGETVRYVCG